MARYYKITIYGLDPAFEEEESESADVESCVSEALSDEGYLDVTNFKRELLEEKDYLKQLSEIPT